MVGKILFSACDAGSANYLIPVLKQLPLQFKVFAQGPAASIFENAGIDFQFVAPCSWENLCEVGESLLKHEIFRFVVAGTSWGATVDKAIIQAAQKYHIPSVAIIEHWNLYRERFSRLENGNLIESDLFLPNQIWVNDEIAKNQAIEAGLSVDRLIAVGQPFLEFQYHQLCKKKKRIQNQQIVFVSERIREDFVKGSSIDRKYDEYSVLESLCKVFDFSKYELIIKLHPQEDKNKYQNLVSHNSQIKTIKQCDIFELILTSKKFLGMASMLLIEAALVRNDVFSFMPGTSEDDFIGNIIGATSFGSTISDLKKYLNASSGIIEESDFGKRFFGSTQNILMLLASI